MKLRNIIVISVIVICFHLFWRINFAMSEEHYLIGTAELNEMEVFSLNEGVFKLHKKIKLPEITHFQWPNYNRATHDLYFEGHCEVPKHRGQYIYKYNPANNPQIEQLLEARYPALSPDGKWLAYYKHPGKLGILNLKNKQTKKIADDMDNNQPPVWISNNRMLYYSINNQLILLDTSTGEKRMTGYEKIIPGALSPDGKTVLCGTFDGNKIILYSINDNKIETVYENRLSIATSFIWRPDGRSFLFHRQTWTQQIQLREGGSLFLFSLDDRTEKDLNSGIGLFGGVVWEFKE